MFGDVQDIKVKYRSLSLIDVEGYTYVIKVNATI